MQSTKGEHICGKHWIIILSSTVFKSKISCVTKRIERKCYEWFWRRARKKTAKRLVNMSVSSAGKFYCSPNFSRKGSFSPRSRNTKQTPSGSDKERFFSKFKWLWFQLKVWGRNLQWKESRFFKIHKLTRLTQGKLMSDFSRWTDEQHFTCSLCSFLAKVPAIVHVEHELNCVF